MSNEKRAMKNKLNWKELYQDLPENTAAILREKRVKPEQLTTKADGEILALGLSDTDLETIRTKYAIVIPTAVGAHHDAPSIKSESPSIKSESPSIKSESPSIKSDAPSSEVVKPSSASHFAKYPRHIHGRSQRYQALAKTINRNQTLIPPAALEKLISLARTGKTIDLHLNVLDTGLRGEVKVPYSTGKTIRVEIFSDKTIIALNNNEFNFDVLLATPADMGKLAKYAKVLGPKGLMPNPKSGTVTTDPEGRAKQLSTGATIAYKTEPKFPIIHVSLGKTNQKLEELTGNLTTLLREIGLTKITSAYLTANQTPSVRLDLSSLG